MTTLQTLSAKSLSLPTQNTGIVSAIYQHFPKIINMYFGALLLIYFKRFTFLISPEGTLEE